MSQEVEQKKNTQKKSPEEAEEKKVPPTTKKPPVKKAADGKTDTTEEGDEKPSDPNIAGMGPHDVRLKINVELYHGTDGFLDRISGTSDLSRALHPHNLARAQKELGQLLQLHFVKPYQSLIRQIVVQEQEKHGKQVTEPKGSHLLEQFDESADEDDDSSSEDAWPTT